MPEALLGALPAQLDWFGVWLLGLSMGLTACTITCLPFLGSWVLGRGLSARAAFVDTAVFLLGRVSAYTVLGAVAGALGGWLAATLEAHAGQIVIGLAAAVAGLWLLRPDRAHAPCGPAKRGDRLPPFFLGFALSLAPCAPLAALLAACALSGEFLAGAAYGAWFGVGAAVTPLVFIVPLVGLSGRKLLAGRPGLAAWLRRGAGALLLALGLRRLLLVV